MTAYNLDHLRRPLLDAAHECHTVRTGFVGNATRNRALERAETVLFTAAERLGQAALCGGIDIGGDLTLADKLAGCQQAWNAGDASTAMDRLLEAHAHIRREMGVTA